MQPALCESFAIEGKVPVSVVVVHVERVYFQCSKALIRSRLWEADAQITRAELPSNGEMLAALSKGEVEAESYDAAYPQRLKDTIY